MKNALIIVLAVVSLTFGTLYLRQSQKAFQTDATISRTTSAGNPLCVLTRGC